MDESLELKLRRIAEEDGFVSIDHLLHEMIDVYTVSQTDRDAAEAILRARVKEGLDDLDNDRVSDLTI